MLPPDVQPTIRRLRYTVQVEAENGFIRRTGTDANNEYRVTSVPCGETIVTLILPRPFVKTFDRTMVTEKCYSISVLHVNPTTGIKIVDVDSTEAEADFGVDNMEARADFVVEACLCDFRPPVINSFAVM